MARLRGTLMKRNGLGAKEQRSFGPGSTKQIAAVRGMAVYDVISAAGTNGTCCTFGGTDRATPAPGRVPFPDARDVTGVIICLQLPKHNKGVHITQLRMEKGIRQCANDSKSGTLP